MSKDGDWIVRDDDEALGHILEVLDQHGAHYRFGAPFARRWLQHGWSSHFEFKESGIRVRTDFVSVPPRVTSEELTALWAVVDNDAPTVIPRELLLKVKTTQRAKDYPILAELSRDLADREPLLRYGRDAARIIEAFEQLSTEEVKHWCAVRPALAAATKGAATLELDLFKEQQQLMSADAERLARYERAAQRWAKAWVTLSADLQSMNLAIAHQKICEAAADVLPEKV